MWHTMLAAACGGRRGEMGGVRTKVEGGLWELGVSAAGFVSVFYGAA